MFCWISCCSYFEFWFRIEFGSLRRLPMLTAPLIECELLLIDLSSGSRSSLERKAGWWAWRRFVLGPRCLALNTFLKSWYVLSGPSVNIYDCELKLPCLPTPTILLRELSLCAGNKKFCDGDCIWFICSFKRSRSVCDDCLPSSS